MLIIFTQSKWKRKWYLSARRGPAEIWTVRRSRVRPIYEDIAM